MAIDKISERRLKENEVIFQQANKGVADFILEETNERDPVVKFYCECSNMDCRERIPLSASHYRKLHKTERFFIAITGHEIPEIERIISRHDGFVVIEKQGEIPSVKDSEVMLPEVAERL